MRKYSKNRKLRVCSPVAGLFITMLGPISMLRDRPKSLRWMKIFDTRNVKHMTLTEQITKNKKN